MLNEIINLFQIGKSLGLKPKEISKVLMNKPHSLKSNILFSIFIAAIVVYIIILFIVIGSAFINPGLPPNQQDNTYVPGTFYSTVRLRDFKKKR
jgi:hypothetical protein